MAGVVLIAIDSSAQAEAAFEWYLRHIHRPGNSIVILHSIDLSAITVQDDKETSNDTFCKSWDRTKGKIKQLEDKYRWKLNENGLPGQIRTESGKPGEIIVKAALKEKAGMIVIGSRGLGKLKRTLVGSVSDYVLHNAPCPVIICRQQE